MDDDMVPELYLEGTTTAGGDRLLYLNNGEVQTDGYFSNGSGMYIPYTGLINDEGSHDFAVWTDNYRLEKGQLIKLGRWAGHTSDIDPETGDIRIPAPNEPEYIIDWWWLDENEVTQEQYQETINALVGGKEFQNCVSTQYTSVLEILENMINWGL